MAARNLVTARQLERMGRHDLELVRGELVPVMTPAGEQHGTLVAFLTAELWVFVQTHDLGRVYVEVGYKLFSNPDTVRGPDVSFVAHKRETSGKRRRGFIPGTPDLAVEIASSEKPVKQLTAKAVEYLEAGTRLVWVVDPKRRTVRVHSPGRRAETLSQTAELDGADVLPGFTLSLSRLFAQLDA